MKKIVLIIVSIISNFCTASFFDSVQQIPFNKILFSKESYTVIQFAAPMLLYMLYFKHKDQYAIDFFKTSEKHLQIEEFLEKFSTYSFMSLALQTFIQFSFNKKEFLKGLTNVAINASFTTIGGLFGTLLLTQVTERFPCTKNKIIPFYLSLIIPFSWSAFACKHQSFS